MNKKNYDLLDGLFALIFTGLLFVGYVFLMNMYYRHYLDAIFISDEFVLLSQIIFCAVFIGIMALYLLLRKQKPKTIGLTGKNLFKSIRFGLVYALVYIVVFFIIHTLRDDLAFRYDFKTVILNFFYFLFLVAFFEEVLFRGFINSRLLGLTKNKYLNLILVSVLFSLMHWPFRAFGFSGTVRDYFLDNYSYHSILAILHFIFQYLYERYRNIAAPLILHFIYDYIQWLFL